MKKLRCIVCEKFDRNHIVNNNHYYINYCRLAYFIMNKRYTHVPAW